jgi:uncharacterized protein (DUF2141 family)
MNRGYFMQKLSIIALLAFSANASAATVQVNIAGVSSGKGVLQVALCDEAAYPKDCRLTATAPARAGSVMVEVLNVPSGTWAALAYHDENSNKKLDANFFGKPVEGYGFSNGANAMFSAPKFKDAAFTVGEGVVPATVTLKY